MKIIKKILLSLLLLMVVVVFLNIPVTTKQGIDFVVAAKKIPLYVKACGFLYRNYQYKELSGIITKDIENERGKVSAIYNWTVENIKKQPKDLPIIDDHIWYIIVRGYGVADQTANVFTALASYAGFDAFWTTSKISRDLILSFIKIDDKWHMFDVYNRRSFISKEDMNLKTPAGLTYGEHLERIDKSFFERRFRRADKQKILPRIVYEIGELFRR